MHAARFESNQVARPETDPLRRSGELAALRRSQVIHVPTSAAPRAGWTSSVALRAFVVLALAVGVSLFQPWKLRPSEAEATATGSENAAAPRVVNVVQPQRAATADVVLPATVRPWQTTALHARVNGYLAAWHKDLGATVTAGELLAEIETPELDQEVAEGIASAAEARAAAAQAHAELAEAEADLQVAEAQLVRVRAEADLALAQLSRRDKLLVSNAISNEEHETFQKAADARVADVAAAEADVSRRRKNLATRDAVIAAREATAASREADVERLKELQAFQKITAPFDGVITARAAEVGKLVTAGGESLFTVEDLSRVRVQVNVPQAYAVQTVPGVAARVQVPESSADPVAATVTRTSESVDPTSRTLLAEIELPNAERRLQPGSYVQVTLTTSQSSSAWTIPTNTLQMRVDGPHVAVLGADDRVELRPVVLGRDLGNRVIVARGIEGRERLVVNPGDDLRDHAIVQTSGAAAPSFDVAHREAQTGE